jgi:RHS repeat-associated protein
MVGTMEEERFARLNHRDSETSLDPTHFRMYASGVGRWQSPDALGGSVFNPQSLNRYAYVLNNPLNLNDLLGLDSCWNYSSYEGSGSPPLCSSGPTYSGAPASYVMDGVSVPGYVISGALNGGFASQCGSYCGPTTLYEENLTSIQTCNATAVGWNCTQTPPTYLGTSLQQFQGNYFNQLNAVANALLAAGENPNEVGAFVSANSSPDWASVANGGGNFDFSATGPGYDFTGLGSACPYGRCDEGGLGTLDFSHDYGTSFHLDTGDPYNFPTGTFTHGWYDVIGGNTWWGGGIPR